MRKSRRIEQALCFKAAQSRQASARQARKTQRGAQADRLEASGTVRQGTRLIQATKKPIS